MGVSGLPRGLIIDLITPFKKGGDLDGRGLEKHLERVMPHVQGVFLASPFGGEGKNLSPQRREELLDRTLFIVKGQRPILVWVSQDTSETTQETLLLLKRRVQKRRYPGQILWVDTPLFHHSNRGLGSYYERLSSLISEVFLIHNDPDLIQGLSRPFKRTNIRTSILKELTRINALKGLISSGPLERARNYQMAVRSSVQFRIYDGDETNFLTYPSLSGVVSIGANLFPKAWGKITSFSINLSSDLRSYPDYLRQIWDLGQYLRKLRNIYSKEAAPLVKHMLWEMEFIGDPACTFQVNGMKEKVSLLRGLMNDRKDYPFL
ncbi:MAG: dihydrodipicolinate synthase family protein [Pseudomonadota bacterium]